MSCYNAGVLGQQILFHKTLQSIVLERTRPDVIILDVDPGTLYESTDAYDRLAELRPFYFRHPEAIGPVLYRRSLLEELFLQSKLYQYNSTIVHVLRYAIAPQPDVNGYRPDYGVMAEPTAKQERDDFAQNLRFRTNRSLDPVMVDALERFAADARRKNVKVFYFMSPGALPYRFEGSASSRKIEEVVGQAGIPFFNFRNHAEFLRHYALFADSGHLNDAGARLYSKLVADAIRAHLGVGAFVVSLQVRFSGTEAERQHVEPVVLQLDPLLHHLLDAVPAAGPGVDPARALDGLAADGNPGAAQRGSVDQLGSPAPEEWRHDDDRPDALALQVPLNVPRRVQR